MKKKKNKLPAQTEQSNLAPCFDKYRKKDK